MINSLINSLINQFFFIHFNYFSVSWLLFEGSQGPLSPPRRTSITTYFMHVFIYLFIYLFICLFICLFILFIHLSIYSSIYLFIHLCIYLFIHLFVYLYVFIYLIYLFICIYLCVYLFIHLFRCERPNSKPEVERFPVGQAWATSLVIGQGAWRILFSQCSKGIENTLLKQLPGWRLVGQA